ncbi:hypothetical protein AFLA_012142 [Aspergillus flavus NRRL3357]|nr:hypothetical protein AFLA_012142 [Aspergillus flavus NRRL3357]
MPLMTKRKPYTAVQPTAKVYDEFKTKISTQSIYSSLKPCPSIALRILSISSCSCGATLPRHELPPALPSKFQLILIKCPKRLIVRRSILLLPLLSQSLHINNLLHPQTRLPENRSSVSGYPMASPITPDVNGGRFSS